MNGQFGCRARLRPVWSCRFGSPRGPPALSGTGYRGSEQLSFQTPPRASADQVRVRWDALPEPVRRYLRYAILAGAPAIRTARLKHDGLLRMALALGVRRVRRGVLHRSQTRVRVERERADGAGPLVGGSRLPLVGPGRNAREAVSTFTVVQASGPEIDQGARLRWLAENVWFPCGFIGDAIQWYRSMVTLPG